MIPQFVAPIFSSDVSISKSDSLLNVCKWSPRKNVEAAIRAVDHLRRKHLSAYNDYQLLLVGDVNQSTHSTRILEMVRRRQRYVACTGVLTDTQLSGLYRASKALLLLSHYEGFGIPAIEAMASGTPVIASDIPSLREVCGKAAIYVNPTDTPRVSDAIHSLLSDTNKYNELVEAGRAQATMFDRDLVINAFLRLIHDVNE